MADPQLPVDIFSLFEQPAPPRPDYRRQVGQLEIDLPELDPVIIPPEIIFEETTQDEPWSINAIPGNLHIIAPPTYAQATGVGEGREAEGQRIRNRGGTSRGSVAGRNRRRGGRHGHNRPGNDAPRADRRVVQVGPTRDPLQVLVGDDPPRESTGDHSPDVWADVEERLLGHLRLFTHGVVRSPETPASLMQKAAAWLRANEVHLGAFAHPRAQGAIAARCVNRAMIVGRLEEELLDVYGNPAHMERIGDYNAAIRDMVDRRQRVGPGWWSLVGAGLVGGLGLMLGINRSVGLAATASAATVGAFVAYTDARPQIEYRWGRTWRWPRPRDL